METLELLDRGGVIMSKKLMYLLSVVLVLVPAAYVANADIKTGLVGYWPLNA